MGVIKSVHFWGCCLVCAHFVFVGLVHIVCALVLVHIVSMNLFVHIVGLTGLFHIVSVLMDFSAICVQQCGWIC